MSDTATLVSVRTGHVRAMGIPGSTDRLTAEWHSAYLKSEVAGRVRVTRLGLEGDEQADKKVHGGPQMAVLAYSAGHYPRWRHELELPEMGPGGFGENLVIDGLHESTVCIGDVFSIGEARLQVSQPRGPCFAIAKRWQRADLLDRAVQTGRTGWYLRVLDEGSVGTGDVVTLIERPRPEWDVLRVFRLRMAAASDPAAVRVLATLPELSLAWRERFARFAAGLVE